MNKEKMISEFNYGNVRCFATKYVPNQVGERYKFSRYLIDPNKFRFRTVIRILPVAFLFIQKISKNIIRSFKILENVQPCESNIGMYVVSLRHSHGSNLQPKAAVVHLSENILNSAKKKLFRESNLGSETIC